MLTVDIVECIAYFGGKARFVQYSLYILLCALFTIHIVLHCSKCILLSTMFTVLLSALFTGVDIVEWVAYFGGKTKFVQYSLYILLCIVQSAYC